MKAVEVQVHWAGETLSKIYWDFNCCDFQRMFLISVVGQEAFIEMEHVLQPVNAKIKVDQFLDLVPLGLYTNI